MQNVWNDEMVQIGHQRFTVQRGWNIARDYSKNLQERLSIPVTSFIAHVAAPISSYDVLSRFFAASLMVVRTQIWRKNFCQWNFLRCKKHNVNFFEISKTDMKRCSHAFQL